MLGSRSFGRRAIGACTADTLLLTSGVQQLIANHQQILSETVYRSFEVPLLHELDKWRAAVDDEEEGYASKVREHSREIRRLEKEGLKLQRQKRRDLGGFRAHLVELTGKLDGLTGLHGEHARTLLRESQETSVRIVEASCSLVRAEVDIFEGLARKGWSGGGLEEVLERGVDVLGGDGRGGGGGENGQEGGGGEGELFSILSPKSILVDSASDTAGTKERPGMGLQTRSESLLPTEGDRRHLSAAARQEQDADSIFSEFNRPRLGGVRPFSPQPQPLSMNPDHLILAGGFEDDRKASLDMSGGLQEPVQDEDDGDDGDKHVDDPWRNEGLDVKNSSSEDQHLRPGLDRQDSLEIATPMTVRRRWSVTVEDQTGGS